MTSMSMAKNEIAEDRQSQNDKLHDELAISKMIRPRPMV